MPGVPITDYCDQKQLNIRGRLELFIKVCDGVQHAHLKAVIHRDLKPANILVTEVDGKPLPRIIDFGVAKATTPLTPEETMLTRLGSCIGTPEYMSPEQADPGVHDVETRTDVYSLGVLFYVLLTGSLPLDSRKNANEQRVQLQRTRLERDRANRERDRATRITDFMTGMFQVSDPSEQRGNSVTAREILDKASNEIKTGLATDPDASRATVLGQQSLEIRQRILGPEHPDTLESMNDLARGSTGSRGPRLTEKSFPSLCDPAQL